VQGFGSSRVSAMSTAILEEPKAYVVAEVEVRDAVAYEDYKSAVVPIVAQ